MSRHAGGVGVGNQSIRQMPSGASFDEVFVTDLSGMDTWARVADAGQLRRHGLVIEVANLSLVTSRRGEPSKM